MIDKMLASSKFYWVCQAMLLCIGLMIQYAFVGFNPLNFALVIVGFAIGLSIGKDINDGRFRR